MTSFEMAPNYDSNTSFDRITGFFEAPVDGDYQFHMSCDDLCHYYMSLSDPMNPAAMELLIYRHAYSQFRRFSPMEYNSGPTNGADTSDIGFVFSEWVTLT